MSAAVGSDFDWHAIDERPCWVVETAGGPGNGYVPLGLNWRGRAEDEEAAKEAAAKTAAIAWRVCAQASGRAGSVPGWIERATRTEAMTGAEPFPSFKPGPPLRDMVDGRDGDEALASRSANAIKALGRAFAATEDLPLDRALCIYLGGPLPSVATYVGFSIKSRRGGAKIVREPKAIQEAATAIAIAHWANPGQGRLITNGEAIAGGAASATLRAAEADVLRRERVDNATIAADFLWEIGCHEQAEALMAAYGARP